MLPDERVLSCAGAGRALPSGAALAAVVNLAVMVGGRSAGPSIDMSAVRESAALAVRMLDDAAAVFGTENLDLRVGWIGAADALSGIGLTYPSPQGRALMSQVAARLAEGCLEASVDLAQERGARVQVEPGRRRRWSGLGFDAALVMRACRYGLRYRSLTAIAPHPLLAAFANGVADGIDPPTIASRPGPGRQLDPSPLRSTSVPDPAAGLAMRAAVQPWIDAPIGD